MAIRDSESEPGSVSPVNPRARVRTRPSRRRATAVPFARDNIVRLVHPLTRASFAVRNMQDRRSPADSNRTHPRIRARHPVSNGRPAPCRLRAPPGKGAQRARSSAACAAHPLSRRGRRRPPLYAPVFGRTAGESNPAPRRRRLLSRERRARARNTARTGRQGARSPGPQAPPVFKTGAAPSATLPSARRAPPPHRSSASFAWVDPFRRGATKKAGRPRKADRLDVTLGL